MDHNDRLIVGDGADIPNTETGTVWVPYLGKLFNFKINTGILLHLVIRFRYFTGCGGEIPWYDNFVSRDRSSQ